MEIRPVTVADLDGLAEIDATIESSRYLHLDQSGSELNIAWRLEERPLRAKLIEPNRMTDEQRFTIRQFASGADEGISLMAEYEAKPLAVIVAQPRESRGIMKLLDLRVDFEYRRQGFATGLVYHVVQLARDVGLRAVAAETRANNFPANQMLQKLGFEPAGLDVKRHSNHDLVKEAVTLFWYAALD